MFKTFHLLIKIIHFFNDVCIQNTDNCIPLTTESIKLLKSQKTDCNNNTQKYKNTANTNNYKYLILFSLSFSYYFVQSCQKILIPIFGYLKTLLDICFLINVNLTVCSLRKINHTIYLLFYSILT